MERMENQERENNQEVKAARVQHVIKGDQVKVEIWGEYPDFSISHWNFQLDVLFVQPRGYDTKGFLPEVICALLEAESWMRAWAGGDPLVVWILFAPVTEERLRE
jgi:hypothetical protein